MRSELVFILSLMTNYTKVWRGLTDKRDPVSKKDLA